MYKAIVIGVSAGGMEVLKSILPLLPASFSLPIAIVQHTAGRSDNFLTDYLDKISDIAVKEAEDKEPLRPGHAYIAPAEYHLLIEADCSFSLSVDEPVHYSRPSVDVLFESAVEVFGCSLIGVVLTGANRDGAQGLKKIKTHGGLAIVQDPATAYAKIMPLAALAATKADHIITLEQLVPLLLEINSPQKEKSHGANG